ncbi:MAG: DUF5675 family protein [Bacteroidota bacterium]
MWSFFKRLFSKFLPSSDNSSQNTKEKGLIIDLDPIEEEKPQSPMGEVKRLDLNGKEFLTLQRTKTTDSYTEGKLIWKDREIATTLEGPTPSPAFPDQGSIPESDYKMELRKEGGQHTTYHFKYPEIHEGMIWIKEVDHLAFPYLMAGNDPALAYGNVLVGERVEEGWLLNSESTYLHVYQQLKEELSGKEVVLRILNP